MIPTLNHLSRAYYELGLLGTRSVGEKRSWPYRPKSREELLALCGELSRFDPRLFELLIQTILLQWEHFDWLKFRRTVLKMTTPQVFGVIFEILNRDITHKELANCLRFLIHGISPAPTQYFYHLLYTPGSPMAQRALTNRLKEFEKWGFLASERPVLDADRKNTAGSMSRQARLECLRALITKKKNIRLQDYIQSLSHPISRQQALLDIKELPGIRRKGKGRGAHWVYH